MPHVGEHRIPPPGDDAGGGRDPDALEADIDRLLAEHTAELQEIERALRATIEGEFPGVVVQVDFGNKLIAFGRSMKMRGLLFAIIAHQSWINLQLADGALLPDPDGLIEGTGKRIRHVKIRTVEAASSAAVVAVVRAQLSVRPEG
jgi:hypothetical protein